MGRAGPGPEGLVQGVRRLRAADERDQRRPHVAPALPRGPVQGAAHDALALPRHRRRLLLRRPGLLARAQRPDAGGHPVGRLPAALLPDPRHAGAAVAELLADDDVPADR